MALLDKVPGDLSLYIGGMFTLRRRDALHQANVTHVLSVLRMPLDQSLFSPFRHMVIEVDDVDDENLLEHFPATNQFIQEGLNGGGGVLVHCCPSWQFCHPQVKGCPPLVCFGVRLLSPRVLHLLPSNAFCFALPSVPEISTPLVCHTLTPNHSSFQDANLFFLSSAMGKSRSATCVIAYLMQKHNINPSEALAYVRQARSIVEPNEGFMKQLELYGRMRTPDNVEDSPAYQRWVYQREIELSRACGQAPEAEKIRFEDEHVSDQAANFELRCRKCRRPLATSQYLVSHSTPSVINDQNERSPSVGPPPNCAHYFLDPLSWMRPELEQGKLDGRLECPKCHTNVGKYAWQGMQCSCSEWVVPGISLSKSRIDEVKKSAFSEIRRPPGATAPLPANASHSRQNL